MEKKCAEEVKSRFNGARRPIARRQKLYLDLTNFWQIKKRMLNPLLITYKLCNHLLQVLSKECLPFLYHNNYSPFPHHYEGLQP